MSEPTFKLKRRYVLGLGNWLNSLSLAGRESRERTKFVDLLALEMQENEAVRLELLKKYAEKDENGEPKIVDSDNSRRHYSVPDDKMEDFTKEMQSYLDEDMVVDGEGNRQRIKTVKDIVLNTDSKIDGATAPEYNAWCEAFEAVEA